MNEVRAMRLSAGMTTRQLVDTMKRYYPRATVAAYSAAEHAESSGITLTPAAKRLLSDLLNIAPKERRSSPYRWAFRCNESLHALLNRLKTDARYQTVNDFLLLVVDFYIKSAAAGAGTPTTAKKKEAASTVPEAPRFVKEARNV